MAIIHNDPEYQMGRRDAAGNHVVVCPRCGHCPHCGSGGGTYIRPPDPTPLWRGPYYVGDPVPGSPGYIQVTC